MPRIARSTALLSISKSPSSQNRVSAVRFFSV
jgi:hypothetical protein